MRSIEYVYESEVEPDDDVVDASGTIMRAAVDMPGSLVTAKEAQPKEDPAVAVVKNDGNYDVFDDWSHVSESELSGTRKKLKIMTISGNNDNCSTILNEQDAMSTASSWSFVRGAGNEGQSHAGSEKSSLHTFIPSWSVVDYMYDSKSTKPNHHTGNKSLLSSVTSQTEHSNLVAKIPQLHLPSSAINPSSMVSCPSCTMDNLPGAQTCVACELSITANPQTDVDHQIALRLAAVVDEEGNRTGVLGGQQEISTQDLQSLLWDGTVRPSQGRLQEIYHWADIISKEVHAMSDTISSQKVCKVVSNVVTNKDFLIQYLIRFQKQRKQRKQKRPKLENRSNRNATSTGAKEASASLTFAFFLTSRPCKEVWEQGVVTEKTGHEYIVPAEGGYTTPYPSQQLTLGNSVPDFVWLVLLDKGTVKSPLHHQIQSRECEHAPEGLFARHREEDLWRLHSEINNTHQPIGFLWKVYADTEIVPLMCTANANFRRPYRPRLNTIKTHCSRTTSGKQSIEKDNDNDLTEIYHQAYTKMRDGLRIK